MVPNTITFSNPPIRVVYAVEEPIHVQEWTESNVELLIRSKAKEYGVDELELLSTVKCENPPLDPLLQSYVPSKNGPNGREDSWGLGQWHMPSKNTDKEGNIITKEMAQDPIISMDLMAWYFSKGEDYKKKWTCWRNLYGR